MLNSGQSQNHTAKGDDGTYFNGALTPWLHDDKVWGARNEINLLNPAETYYDVSYIYGISDGTCGPATGNNLSGERNTLEKANQAWRTLNQTTKNHLLTFPQYLKEGGNGSLVYINMGEEAWPYLAPEVIWFFQVTAGLKGYLSPGSYNNPATNQKMVWPNGSIQAALVPQADRQTLLALTDTIVITAY